MSRLMKLLILLIVVAVVAMLFLLFFVDNSFILAPEFFVKDVITPKKVAEVIPNADIEKQLPLANPPETIKAIYSTPWSAGSEKKLQYFFNIFDTTEINAIVIDVKDYTGMISYEPDPSLAKMYGAFQRKIPKINNLIKRLHDRGVYVIARIAVFQDPKLVEVRPDLGLRSSETGELWMDYKKIKWLDTSSKDVWDYNINIAKDALGRGFDEINLDYIRFASDGKLSDIVYPFYSTSTLKHTVLRDFFKYVRQELPDAKLSADLFGEVTHARVDIGVGQVLEDAFGNFDYISPMVYPSHYGKGFQGFENPADYPFEVVSYSMTEATKRLASYYENLMTPSSTMPRITKFRPWIQDFDLGADYDAAKIIAQIRGAEQIDIEFNAFGLSSRDLQNGWMVWNAANNYTVEAFLPK